ncbi:MAG: LysR family transcriptional regulator [Burkholderiaceae bacterium]|nr:LysR family transcriptional regulator [Burkholderiaceae bacterium]
MNPTLRQFRAFVTVADLESFSAAAAQLHVTQSALSMLVIQLERELGVRLLDRSTRRMRLTEAGKDLYANARRVLQEVSLAVESVEDLREKRKGRVRIAAPQILAATLLPAAMAEYSHAHPGIDLQLTDTMPQDLVTAVISGQADLAIGPDSGADDRQVLRRTLANDRFWLVVPSDHALARRKTVRWRDALAYPFIAPSQDFVQRFAADFSPYKGDAKLQVVRTVSYITTALGMVTAGLGLTACPGYARPMVRGWGLSARTLVEPQFERAVCLYYLQDKELPIAAQSFVEFLEARMRRPSA